MNVVFIGPVVVQEREIGVARGPHWRHGWQVRATMVAGRRPGAAASSRWPGWATLPLTSLMTLHCWSAAHLATLLLVVTVAVAGAVAKPAPPSATPANTTYQEDEYYYYDYYEDELDDQGLGGSLNMSQFYLPGAGEGSNVPHVPRYMLELYADQTSRHPHMSLAADLVRSFMATTTGESRL